MHPPNSTVVHFDITKAMTLTLKVELSKDPESVSSPVLYCYWANIFIVI
jgi:hypothetical protein